MRFILVGAKLASVDSPAQHPGGIITASRGLIAYAESRGIALDVIDSSQCSFPVPPIHKRLMKAAARHLSLLSRLLKFDIAGVIIFCSCGLSFYEKVIMAVWCRLTGTKSLLFIRSGQFMDDCDKSRILSKLNLLLLKLPNFVGAQGSPWCDFYQSIGLSPERIVLARNWLPPRAGPASGHDCTDRKPSARVTFLFVGWVIREKGILDLIAAIASSPLLREQARLVVVGDGTLLEYARKTSKQQGLENVEFPGWQTNDQVMDHMRHTDVFVLPTYAEGFPNALLEALAQGLPVISTPVGCIADSVIPGVNGFLVQPGDTASLRENMERFLNAPELIAEFSDGSLSIVRKNHDFDYNCASVFKPFGESVTIPKARNSSS